MASTTTTVKPAPSPLATLIKSPLDCLSALAAKASKAGLIAAHRWCDRNIEDIGAGIRREIIAGALRDLVATPRKEVKP